MEVDMKTWYVMVVFIVLGLLMGCGGGKDPIKPSDLTKEEYALRGWSEFIDGDYTTALLNFNSAKSKDATYAEAYIGLGWVYMQTAGSSADAINNAILNLTEAKAKITGTDLRINVALASVYNLQNNATSIISELYPHITGTDSWVHPQVSSVTAVDIHYLLAHAYIITGAKGSEAGSAINDATAWGQIKKALALNPNDTKSLTLRDALRANASRK